MKKVYVILMAVIFSLTACEKDEKNGNTGSNGNCTSGHICFTVNGNTVSLPMKIVAQTQGNFKFEHIDTANGHTSVDIYIDDLTSNNYDFGNAFGAPGHAEFYYRHGTSRSNLDFYYISASLGGSLTLTENNGKYSGTFSLQVKDQLDNSQANITNGSFKDLILQ